jgi:hypothetical protein
VLAFSCNGLKGIQDDSSKNKHATKPKRAIRNPRKSPKTPKNAKQVKPKEVVKSSPTGTVV